MEISQWFDLDTSKCFTGSCKLKFNQLCIYYIFMSYCAKDKYKVKNLMREENVSRWDWFKHASHVCVSMKDTSFETWFKKQKYKNVVPDELMVYALSILFRRHTIIYNMFHPWCTVALKLEININVMKPVKPSNFS